MTKTSGDGLTVAVTGPLAEQANNQSFSSTGLGVLLALIVLLLVFGSIFAALLPILSALLALGTAIGVIGLLSHVLAMPSISPELTLLIGLGVGVDYALFIVTRHRQGLVAGRDVESSIINAVNTSGRAVLFAGIIVCIALLGMFALGVSFLYGLAVAAAIGVALTMVAALTLLPAMLGFIGPKVMSRKQKRNLAENGPRIVGADSKGFWPNWADRVQQLPVALGRRGPDHHRGHRPALLLACSWARPTRAPTRRGRRPASPSTCSPRASARASPGPLELVTVVPQNPAPRWRRSWHAVAKQPGVDQGTPPTTTYIPNKTGDGYVALTTVYPTTVPAGRRHHRPGESSAGHHRAAGGRRLGPERPRRRDDRHLHRLRQRAELEAAALHRPGRDPVVPVADDRVPQLRDPAHCGGHEPALHRRRTRHAGGGLPVGRRSARSSASQGTGPVEAFLPVMLFAILFGLSMDYQVFLVSRMHEEYIKSGGDNRVAVRNGLAATGKTITAAALIMILVFGSFILGGNRVIKEFGIGLAGGILVDAVLIRMAIVPSIMMHVRQGQLVVPGLAGPDSAQAVRRRRRPGAARCPKIPGPSLSRSWPGPSSSRQLTSPTGYRRRLPAAG